MNSIKNIDVSSTLALYFLYTIFKINDQNKLLKKYIVRIDFFENDYTKANFCVGVNMERVSWDSLMEILMMVNIAFYHRKLQIFWIFQKHTFLTLKFFSLGFSNLKIRNFNLSWNKNRKNQKNTTFHFKKSYMSTIKWVVGGFTCGTYKENLMKVNGIVISWYKFGNFSQIFFRSKIFV